MNTPQMRDTDVLIIGAGPTGLVLALWLTRLGARVRIVDKTSEPGTTSRALAVQARTLELYSQVGLADKVVRRFMFRTISQTMVNYRGSSLSDGQAGAVHGGDRLPWMQTDAGGVDKDNFAPLTSLDWQVHVYGKTTPEMEQVCDDRQLTLHIFRWLPQMNRIGLRRDAVYLVRPDGYVALADPEGSPTTLTTYLDMHKLTLTR